MTNMQAAGTYRSFQEERQPVEVKTELRMLVLSSDTFPPSRVDVSVLFGEELASRGHKIDWLLQSEAHCANSYTTDWLGCRVWVGATDLGASLLNRIRKHVIGILHDLKLFPLMRSGRYDFIEVKDKFVSGLFAAVAARLFHKRFIYWLSYPFPEDYLLRAKEGTARYPLLYRIRGLTFKVLLYKVLLRAADHVFVQSEQMRRDLAAEGIPLKKMTAIPMGIKPDRFRVEGYAAARTLIPSTERSFLYLGTLTKVRRLDFLVRVLAHVRQAIPSAKLYIVGRGEDDSDEEVLRKEAARLGVADAMVLVGQLPQAEALRYVHEAEVCVSPYYPTPILNSTSPTKLIEYMAMGKAVVANDHPEQRLIIEESAAGFCVPWNEQAFADAILRLMSEPEEAKVMGERGRRYAIEHRSYAKIADAVENKFMQIASGL